MIVQWCCKGLAKVKREEIEQILFSDVGLRCRDWVSLPAGTPYPIGPALLRLTEQNLDLHVNNYSYRNPQTGRPFYETTPFISLSAGCVERNITAATNITHSALRTALRFATTDYSASGQPRCDGWVVFCYVLVSVNRAVSIPSAAEEVRELNHARAYSPWYTQGEIAAKIYIPFTQILMAIHYKYIVNKGPKATNQLLNPAFTHPAALLDERRML
jgi:hypothetical protein